MTVPLSCRHGACGVCVAQWRGRSWMNSGRKEDMMLAARSGVDTANASGNALQRT
ncbi:2Fe-2S iron-sulfur cluster-binding protein [Cupriavidus numazuensis]|uniref:2Fe-2S iron-sulfur cluster-binding protein n=1 Tax=Cupriavidus numazuensis TaxID=221992 RepID=UPI00387EC440